MIEIGSITKFFVISSISGGLKEQMAKWIGHCELIVTDELPERLSEEKEEGSALLYVCSGPQLDRISQEVTSLQSLQQKGMALAVLVEQDTPSYIKYILALHNIPVIENGGVSVEAFFHHFQMEVLERSRANRVCIFAPSGGMEKSLIAAYMAFRWATDNQVQLVGWDPFSPSLATLMAIGEEKNKGLHAMLSDLDAQHLDGIFNIRLLARYTYQKEKVNVLPAQAGWVEAEKWDLPHMERVWELLDQQADVPVISDLPFYPQAVPTWCALHRATNVILPFHSVSHEVSNAARFLEWLHLAGITNLSIHPVAIGEHGMSKAKVEKALGMQISVVIPDYFFHSCERIEALPGTIRESIDRMIEQIKTTHHMRVQPQASQYVQLSKTG